MMKKQFGWGNLLIGILLIILGFVSLSEPESNLLALSAIFGTAAIVKGLLDIWEAVVFGKLSGSRITGFIILGVIDMLIGIYFLTNLALTAAVLPFVFAIWFIADSFTNLFRFDFLSVVSTGYYVTNLLLSILGILVGVMLLYYPSAAVLSITILISSYFFIFGIMNIWLAFNHYRLFL